MSKSTDLTPGMTDTTTGRIVSEFADAATEIREAIATERQFADEENPSGESQLAADLVADDLLEERLLALDGVGSYASEERESVTVDEGHRHVAVDPLDGSSNLEPNSGMGTIFGVYDTQPPTIGRNLVAAGFVIYGPTTSMVVARNDRVREYIIHDGDARVVDDDVSVPKDPTVYGFGGGRENWNDAFADYATELQERLKLRYGGAMIADVSQVLTYGGLFSYPALEYRPTGKLRLQFEGQPMGYIVEAAGGKSSDGHQSLLDREIDDIHDRTPLHLGNTSLIERLEERYERYE
ncbi:class 1 fructose-bisphosphatase [Halomicrobium mukohataei]|uniref:Fructose-1,6-bisphosphatase class 1 n=1 Tax=Halomicrobium mukohataei TaxID=57705 RepID=A0A847TZ07_9EURY|nr:class 1 fructose-bisphosphatase [Halomicrobium mukohataei]